MVQAQAGTEHAFPRPLGHLGAAHLPGLAGKVGDPRWASPARPSSLGLGLVLGHGDLRGHQEEDVGLKVHHGLLLGLLGRVLGDRKSTRLNSSH